MNKVALITGASSGIGKELAVIHASKKRDLVLVARSADKLNEIKSELEKEHGIEVYTIVKDLSVENSSKEVYDNLRNKGIEVSYLINNAGFGDFGFFHETDWKKEEMMIHLNIRSLTELTKLFGRDMVTRKSGYIMNVASTAAFQPGPLMSVYYASKHYVLAFSEAIANEWKEHNVSVTTLCPGATESGFQKAAGMDNSKLFSKKIPTSQKVATFGYRAMEKRKVVAIEGFMNKLMAFSVRFSPRKVVVAIVRNLQKEK